MKAFVCDPVDMRKINPETDLDGIQPDHALGFLTCTPDLDYENILPPVCSQYPVPLAGGTTLGNPFDLGADPFISRFSVMGKKNMRRHVALSAPLTSDSQRNVMRNLYNQVESALDGDVKLLIPLIPLQPDLYFDPFLDELLECAGDKPVFGGMLSDELHSRRSAVFADGRHHSDRMLLVGIGGDVRPAFGFGCAITVPSDARHVVTAARDNIVLTVDDLPFAEYMRKAGLDASAVADFPVSVRIGLPDRRPDDPVKADALTAVDPDTGAGHLSAAAVAGSTIGLGYLSVDDILDSTRDCLDSLAADMERQKTGGYEYELLLGVSCVARYYTLFEQEPAEAEYIDERLPDLRARFGFYAFSEICPFRRSDGTLVNRKHGKALGLCAI